jgi:hypothetical protein
MIQPVENQPRYWVALQWGDSFVMNNEEKFRAQYVPFGSSGEAVLFVDGDIKADVHLYRYCMQVPDPVRPIGGDRRTLDLIDFVVERPERAVMRYTFIVTPSQFKRPKKAHLLKLLLEVLYPNGAQIIVSQGDGLLTPEGWNVGIFKHDRFLGDVNTEVPEYAAAFQLALWYAATREKLPVVGFEKGAK